MWQINRIDKIEIEYKGAYSMGESIYTGTAVVRFEYLDDKTGGVVDNKILNIRIPQFISNAWSMNRMTHFMSDVIFEEIDKELDLLNGIV